MLFVYNWQEDLGTGYQIAYIDVKEGDKAGHIRMQDSDSAKRLAEATSGSYFFTLLKGKGPNTNNRKCLVNKTATKYNKKTKRHLEVEINKNRMEMWTMSKRQQTDQKADNSLRPPMGLLHSEKIPNPEETCVFTICQALNKSK